MSGTIHAEKHFTVAEETQQGGLRVVAVFEGAKGGLVLVTGLGLLAVIHRDLHSAAEEVVRHFHLNPAHHYPRIFLDAAARVTDTQLWLLALSAFLYAVVRFIEAFGLWHRKLWAEWFGVLSGGIYIPVELLEVTHGLSWAKLMVLSVNLAIVAYLGYALTIPGRPPRNPFLPSAPRPSSLPAQQQRVRSWPGVSDRHRAGLFHCHSLRNRRSNSRLTNSGIAVTLHQAVACTEFASEPGFPKRWGYPIRIKRLSL